MNLRFLYRAYRARFRDQKAEIASMRSSVRPGEVAVDAGAHKGAYLYWLRQSVEKSGKVIAFEPQPQLSARLTDLAAKMGWANVTIRTSALSDSIGTAVLNVPGEGTSPGASLENLAAKGEPCRKHECRKETLDNVFRNESSLRFLKVDVEGHELNVFRGGLETLRQFKPTILFECEQRHLAQHSVFDVFQFLLDLNYDGWFFSPFGLKSINEFDPAVHQRQEGPRFWDAAGYCNNFLFKPAETSISG